jgi:hypothetical protein
MTTHSPSIERFCEELRRDPQFAELADLWHAGLTEVDRLADNSPDHAEFFEALKFIFSNQWHPLGERLDKMCELNKLEGHPVVVNLKEFTGW